MKLGAYTAVLHDRPLADALKVLGDLGLTGAEINSGGFLPPVHIPMDDLLASAAARDDYLGRFRDAGIALTGLNCNGNPLNPLPDIGPAHAADLHRSIEVAGLLGVDRVVTMSGVPGSDPGAAYPSWVVNTWDSQYTDVQDYQWELAVPFWRDVDAPGPGRRRQGVHRDAPAQHRVQPADPAPAGGADRCHQRRSRDGPEPPVLAGDRPGRRGRLARRAGLPRGGQGHPHPRGQLPDLRGARRPAHPGQRQPAEPGRAKLPQPVAGRPGLGVRPRGTRARRGVLGPVPDRTVRVDRDMAVNIEHEDASYDPVEGLRLAAETLIVAKDRAGL
jgi:hypothetical protein